MAVDSTILYRPLGADDLERAVALDAQGFNQPPERARAWLLGGALGQMRGLFIAGRLVAQLEILPLRISTGSGEVACGGIGSVAVAAEDRRRGYAGLLLRHACDEMRAAAMPVSMLFPSRASFYRRYGWAYGMERKHYSGPPAIFRDFPLLPGTWSPAGEADISELDQIYNGALRGRSGPLRRDEQWWRRHVLSDSDGQPFYSYIWRDEQGVGRTYLIYRYTPGLRRERRLICRETVALDPAARSQIFAFLAGHDGQCTEVSFRAPADAPVNLLMPDPLRCEVEPTFMLRLLDLPTALAAFPPPPKLHGRLSIAVSDAWLAHNTGVYSIEVGESTLHVERLPEGATAELSCDIHTLAQIYTRYLRPRTAATFGLLQSTSRDALSLLDKLFIGLVPFNSDHF